MKTGIAMWHYPHRTTIENVRFFAGKGITTLSLNQGQLVDCCVKNEGDTLVQVLKEYNVTLTIHGALTFSNSERDVNDFKRRMDLVGTWQKKYGLISVISFDVCQETRDNVSGYVDYVLEKVPDCFVAVEDFGLTPNERKQIEYLKKNKSFGYLIDIGHMYIRICGRTREDPKKDLFKNFFDECPACDNPGYNEFLKAFQSKEFPIMEVHLHNNNGMEDLHYFFEDGKLDIKVIADVLKKIEYDGIVTIESAPGYRFESRYPESDERILNNYQYWKNLWDNA